VAKHIGCQASYLSQILSGKPDLMLEQAHKLNGLFLHDKTESKFFMILVEMGRANSPELKQYYKDQLAELQTNRYDLKKRLKNTDQISHEDMDKYYSSWLYTAIHIALALPGLQEPSQIAKRFNLPESMVCDIIEFLQSAGLIEKVKGQFEFTKMRIHLDRKSSFIQRHHINWRSQSLQSVEKNLKDDMHFSTVFAVEVSDFNKIKEIMTKTIANATEIIEPSKSEEIYAMTVDLFKVC
jgi:uncharacterized protein (TIGR02147 family)